MSKTPDGKNSIKWLKEHINREEFEKDYCIDKLSKEQLIEKYNVTCWQTLSKLIRYFKIHKTPCNNNLGWLKEHVSKEEIEKDYCIDQLTKEELIKKYNVCSWSVLAKLLSYFRISKRSYGKNNLQWLLQNVNIEEFKKDFCDDDALDDDDIVAKYNTTSIHIIRLFAKHNNLYRSRVFVENKMARTNIKKYGAPFPFQNKNIQEKCIMTSVRKYGTEYPLQSKMIQKKSEQTNLKKYGTKKPFQRQDVQEKCKLTTIDKYGVANASQNINIKEKRKQVMLDKYGVPYACQTKQCLKANHGSHTKPNEDFANMLCTNGFDFDREYTINRFTYDFKINDVLFEINPSITHNSSIKYRNSQNLIKNDYHLIKSQTAWNNNFHCVHVWDWDNVDIIVEQLNHPTEFKITNSTIKTGNICLEFIEKSPSIYEITTDTIFVKSFIVYLKTQKNPSEIKITIDNAKTDQRDLTSLGFIKISETEPSPHNMPLSKKINVNVYDCGTSTWIWKREN